MKSYKVYGVRLDYIEDATKEYQRFLLERSDGTTAYTSIFQHPLPEQLKDVLNHIASYEEKEEKIISIVPAGTQSSSIWPLIYYIITITEFNEE